MANREIPTPETLRQLLRYEPDTGKLYWLERPESLCSNNARWRAYNKRLAGKEAFTATMPYGYRTGMVLGYRTYAHRVIWALHHGQWPVGVIDHINRDPTDNRIVNLRDCSQETNMRNTKKNCWNRSGETGVSWDTKNNRWRVSLGYRGVSLNLGRYKDFDEAVAIRKKVAGALGFIV